MQGMNKLLNDKKICSKNYKIRKNVEIGIYPINVISQKFDQLQH